MSTNQPEAASLVGIAADTPSAGLSWTAEHQWAKGNGVGVGPFTVGVGVVGWI